jgi:hypothetical protein
MIICYICTRFSTTICIARGCLTNQISCNFICIANRRCKSTPVTSVLYLQILFTSKQISMQLGYAWETYKRVINKGSNYPVNSEDVIATISYYGEKTIKSFGKQCADRLFLSGI